MTKLVVFGGAGFLGKRICQAGIDAGFKVTSLTRSGKPPKVASHHDAYWISKVSWKPANIFKPHTYKQDLADAASVVHSVGILIENQDYKAAINSNSSILNEFTSLLKPKNPMSKDPFGTYEAVNRDSAILAAETFQEVASVEDKPFVYISADRGFPGIPSGYIMSKREAEAEIAMLKGLRPIFMRPGFMYDEESNDDTMRNSIHKFVDTLDWTNKRVLGGKFGVLNDLVRPTISTQQVAQAIINRIKDKQFNGIVGLDDMKH
ncbi:CYFA0S11e02102g1_1 [Cyberlindnera fabianii]|uniref:CYFA0S11e02102g1_1 n=1 Tax=Cyberlindnera fabianii TaxID=36022 RepID=A0A061B8K8_CYBFA|nr:CYFA0S11e02102g1_1 [Cyberlindnera fabianii]